MASTRSTARAFCPFVVVLVAMTVCALMMECAAASWSAADQPASNPLNLTLHPSRGAITISQYVTLTGTIDATALAYEQTAELQANNSSYGGWKVVDQIAVWNGGPTTLAFVPIDIDRNTVFRLHVGASAEPPYLPDSYSPTASVYVLPAVTLSVARMGFTNTVAAVYQARVHGLSRYRAQRVYFYRRHASRGPFMLVGSVRLRYVPDELIASLRFNDAAAGQVLACVRYRLIADMGPPFRSRACGRPRLPASRRPRD